MAKKWDLENAKGELVEHYPINSSSTQEIPKEHVVRFWLAGGPVEVTMTADGKSLNIMSGQRIAMEFGRRGQWLVHLLEEGR